MEQLERPEEALWDERRLWFEERQAAYAKDGADAALSEQACALLIDVQAAFCAGAWTAVIILAASIVDSQAFHGGFRGQAGASADDRAWLRGLRNALLHENRQSPAITIEDQWTKRREWERAARRAVEVAFASLYAKSGETRRRS